MPSPSTSTLRSGTMLGSRFSGGGALEKSCCWEVRGLGCSWRNGEKKSPPNQPPPPPNQPPPPERGAARCGGPPKLKNCADAGPTTPTRSAIETASAISGPASVKSLCKGFCLIRPSGANGSNGCCEDNNAIGPQTGEFSLRHKRGPGGWRQGRRHNVLFTVTFTPETGVSVSAQPFQHVGGRETVGRRPDRGLEIA